VPSIPLLLIPSHRIITELVRIVHYAISAAVLKFDVLDFITFLRYIIYVYNMPKQDSIFENNHRSLMKIRGSEKKRLAATMHAFTVLTLFLALAQPVYSQGSPIGAQGRAIEIFYIGRDLESRGSAQEAGAYYTEVIRICTDEISRNAANRDTYTALTWALQRQRNFGDVIIWGERGLRLFADEYRIIETMGEAYFYLDDYDNSLRFMQRYVSSEPMGDRVSVAYFFIGEIYRLEGKYRLADMAYSTAVTLHPGESLWWYRLGLARENSGEALPAADAFEQALRLNPGYQAAREGLARVKHN
jgi:tetratricopeptide (TPR) repeat protein